MRSGLAPKCALACCLQEISTILRVLGLFTSIIINNKYWFFKTWGGPQPSMWQLLLGHDESHPLHRAVHQSLQPRIPPVPRGEDSPFPSLPSCQDFSGFTNMVCLRDPKTSESQIWKNSKISLLVLCQIPGPKKLKCYFATPSNQYGGGPLCLFRQSALTWEGFAKAVILSKILTSQDSRIVLSSPKTWRAAGKALHHEMYHQSSTRNHHAQPQHTLFLPISTGFQTHESASTM